MQPVMRGTGHPADKVGGDPVDPRIHLLRKESLLRRWMDCIATRACPSCPVLCAASRVNPTCGVISAFTRVFRRAMPGNDDRNRCYGRLNDPGPMNPLDSEPKRPLPSEPRMPPPSEPPPVIGRNASGKSDHGLNGVDVVCVLAPVVLPICVPLVVPDVVPDVAPVLAKELPSPAIGTPSCAKVCSVCSGMARACAAAASCCSQGMLAKLCPVLATPRPACRLASACWLRLDKSPAVVLPAP